MGEREQDREQDDCLMEIHENQSLLGIGRMRFRMVSKD
jgi:hypothetical protein